MHDKTRGKRGTRIAGALAVAAAAAVLTAACGASSDPAGSPTYTVAQALALAQCMRGHGVPDFPDPDSSGSFSLTAATLESSSVQAAYGACRHVLPDGGPSIGQLEQQAQQAQQAQQKAAPALVKFATCMRSHGVPSFPDPTDGGFNPSPGKGAINPHSPQFQAAMQACQHLLPGGVHMHTSVSSS